MTELHPADDLVALALGDLEPVARDHVLRHLSTCLGCRETYDALAATVEATLAAAPQVDPPLGFEDRALAAMGIAAPAPRPEPAPIPTRQVHRLLRAGRSRWALAAAGLVAGLALGALAATVASDQDVPAAAGDGSATTAPAAAGQALRTSDGATVGTVTRGFRDRRVVYVVTVQSGPIGMRYVCVLQFADGRSVRAAKWTLRSTPVTWVVDSPPGAVDQVELVANGGRGPVWSRASV